MSRKIKEAVVIILDVGRSSKLLIDDDESFYEKSLACASMIIQRKIFSLSKDEIGLILLGTKEKANPLDYDNISVPFSLQLPSWDFVEYLHKSVESSNVDGDWLDAIVTALQFLRDETENKTFAGKHVVLFTNCATAVSDNQVDTIMKGLKHSGVELTVIGPDVISQSLSQSDGTDEENSNEPNHTSGTRNGQKSKSMVREAGEALLAKIITEVGGVICSFEEAIPQLTLYQKKAVRPSPWNVEMTIGPDIRIPVTGYRTVAEVMLQPWKLASIIDPKALVAKETTYIKQNEDMTSVDKENVIEGYCFGSTIVPFTGDDKDAMSYTAGPKCLSVHGFSLRSDIPRHLIVGTGVLHIVAQDENPEASAALSAFILALDELKMVAIARRVYNNGNAPCLGVLVPKVSSDYECFVYLELPYSEDMRQFVFPPMVQQKNEPTQEQLDCIDSLIDSMDLMIADDGEEALDPKKTMNVYHQHFYSCLSQRVIYPESGIPQIKPNIKSLLECPFNDDDNYKVVVQKMKSLFDLVKVQPKNPRRRAADVFKQSDDHDGAAITNVTDIPPSKMKKVDLTSSTVIEIRTLNPEQDFTDLLERGEPFPNVCKQMQKVILNLVLNSFGTDNFDKAKSAFKLLRKVCGDVDPDLYNNWIILFKNNLLERGKKPFWDIMVNENLGLISCNDSLKSKISEEAAVQFLDHVEAQKSVTEQDLDMDVDALMDEM